MRMRKWATAGLAAGMLAAGVGYGQQPTGTGTKTTTTGTTTGTKTGTGTATGSTTTTGSGTGTTTATTDTSSSKALIQTEVDDLATFIDMVVDEFGIVVEDEQQARQVVLVATHFYLWAKMEAFQQQQQTTGPRRR